MKISVIMPVYNKVKYIDRTINSILNQTYKNFELIIIDDGSTDGSEKICDEYAKKDKRIKVIHLKNSGVSNARNIGLDNATGKYIQFIDSDDYIDENMLEKLYRKMVNYNVDIIISGVTKVNHEHKVLKQIIPQLKGIKTKDEMLENFSSEQYNTGIYGCVSNKFINRSIIEKFKLRFNTDIRLAEDLDFYLELYKYVSSIYFYDKSFYYYIQNTENSSTSDDIEHDYLTQILISLKQKILLSQNKMLNEVNQQTINFVITNFTLCYVYDKFEYSYFKYKKHLEYIFNNMSIKRSLVKYNQNNFNKILIYLVSKNMSVLLYILLLNKMIIRNTYRKFKQIIDRRK